MGCRPGDIVHSCGAEFKPLQDHYVKTLRELKQPGRHSCNEMAQRLKKYWDIGVKNGKACSSTAPTVAPAVPSPTGQGGSFQAVNDAVKAEAVSPLKDCIEELTKLRSEIANEEQEIKNSDLVFRAEANSVRSNLSSPPSTPCLANFRGPLPTVTDRLHNLKIGILNQMVQISTQAEKDIQDHQNEIQGAGKYIKDQKGTENKMGTITSPKP